MKTIIAALAIALSGTMASPTFAAADGVTAYESHILQCFALLLTGSAERGELCGISKDTVVVVPPGGPSGGTRPGHPDILCAPGTEWTYSPVLGWLCDWPKA